jgi:hypothetical protein
MSVNPLSNTSQSQGQVDQRNDAMKQTAMAKLKKRLTIVLEE